MAGKLQVGKLERVPAREPWVCWPGGKRKAPDAVLSRIRKNKSGSSPGSAEGVTPEGGGPSPRVRTCRKEGTGCVSGGEGEEPGAMVPLAWGALSASSASCCPQHQTGIGLSPRCSQTFM